MPRRLRAASGGIVYHVFNRAVGRMTLFEKDEDYAAFERTLADVHRQLPVSILSYCAMPNHWHFALLPDKDGDLSEFMRLLTVTHTQRWHAAHGTAGTGPLYQGRFKSFPVQDDHHLLIVCRYGERNAVRAGFVRRAEKWRWCSAWHRVQHRPAAWLLPLAHWPIHVPQNWADLVNKPLTKAELSAVRGSVKRGAPFGGERWVGQTAARLGLGSTLRPRGRPRLGKPKPR
jgi:putative transposase